MSFSLKYKPVKLASGMTIYRPLIPITFEGKIKIDALGILDSGSDITIIPSDMAEVLGIESAKENIVFGISKEPVKAKEGKISVKFGKGKEIYQFEIPLLIPIEKNTSIIIGRIGFFNQFKITFLESERKTEFKKSEPFAIRY